MKGICTSGVGMALSKLQNDFCHFVTNVAAVNSDLLSGLKSGVFCFKTSVAAYFFFSLLWSVFFSPYPSCTEPWGWISGIWPGQFDKKEHTIVENWPQGFNIAQGQLQEYRFSKAGRSSDFQLWTTDHIRIQRFHVLKQSYSNYSFFIIKFHHIW